MRIRDVYYWYIDYRDFADVVKYRIAMMRKGIDQKVKEVGRLFSHTGRC
jgi:transcription initiation factor TFIIE subunit alpha